MSAAIAGDGFSSLLALARKEAPGLGISVSALYRNLRRTNGDLEAAVERYLNSREYRSARPVVWQGRTFATRQAFIGWLAHELHLRATTVSSRLYQHKWDIAATLAAFHEEDARWAAAIARAEAAREEDEARARAEAAKTVTVTEPVSTPESAEPVTAESVAPESVESVIPESVAPESRSPGSTPPSGKHNSSVPVLYRGHWFPSKTAFARYLSKQEGLTFATVSAWLFPPLDDDVQLRFEFFIRRETWLRDAAPAVELGLQIYAGRLYPARAPLVRWLAEQISGTHEEITAVLRGLAGDVTREVELYCDAFDLFIPPADPSAPELPTSASSQGSPAPLPAPPAGLKTETGNGHAVDGIIAAACPARPRLDGTGAIMVDGLATTIAEHIAAIVAAFTAQQTPAAATTTAIDASAASQGLDIASLVRALADQENQLARLSARIAQLERAEGDNRQVLGTVSDTLAVVLHKTGQICHDFGQMTRPRAPVRHTRARPLGIEPKEKSS